MVQKANTIEELLQDCPVNSVIGDNLRSKEDYEMFLKFWNRPVAKVLTKIYSLSEKENNV